ncbi:MAG: 2OG-Fe(II) oxygenase family protein [Pseudomonadota bacterium]
MATQQEHDSTAELGSIPSIHLDALESAEERSRLDQACRDWGFFQLLGHDINSSRRQQTFTAMSRFFQQPTTIKRGIERSADNPWGFYDQELTKNTRDWKEIFDVGPAVPDGRLAGATPQWPSLDGFREAITHHSITCEQIAQRLLAALARTLSARPAELEQAFEPAHTSFLRLNYYPPCSRPEAPAGLATASTGHLGINHHTDAGALTVLMQDAVDGLQVYKDGCWHTIEPLADALIINIGDIVQVWSNDRYHAPLHRVLANANRERFSAAYFYNPSASAVYAPLSHLGTPRYQPISWGEFRTARAAGDYANQGEEIQISHFRRTAG